MSVLASRDATFRRTLPIVMDGYRVGKGKL